MGGAAPMSYVYGLSLGEPDLVRRDKGNGLYGSSN
jgi:hypothetical protein